MLDINLVKQKLQDLINEERLNKNITDIRFEPNKGRYFVILDNSGEAVIIEEWMEDYLEGQDLDRRGQIIRSIKNAAEWK
ncbi:hypothetical protein KJA13_04115 [Patescibacteria group bacterium]|nr:hypothetical protein [Patescibacteria group bacterium]